MALYLKLDNLGDEFEFLDTFNFYQSAILDRYVEILPYASEAAFDTLCGAE